jgi:hypothetical protein
MDTDGIKQMQSCLLLCMNATLYERMSENFKQGIFCHSERNEVERRIPIFRCGSRC